MAKNAKGIIQNNRLVTEMLRKLKSDKTQYPVLNKEQEQELIAKHKDNPDEWRKLLIMHNIRSVFSIARKYSTKTNSFDDMISRGILGLSIAADRFDPTLGNKFSTFAYPWIFKYVVDEFYRRSTPIDNVSVSINEPYRIKNSTNENLTLENYIDDYIVPGFTTVKTIEDELSSSEQHDLYSKIREYVVNDAQLSATDKQVFVNMFYDRKKTKEISENLGIKTSEVISSKNHVLQKVRTFLKDKMSIMSFQDIKEQFLDIQLIKLLGQPKFGQHLSYNISKDILRYVKTIQ